jgi:hypothetical protein
MAKYFANVAGFLKEVTASLVSTGAPDSGKIPALDSAGRLDISMMPAGVSAEVVVCVASEALAAGDFVNIYNNAAALNARKADATTNAKPAFGFVLAAVSSSASATVYLLSTTNTAVTGLTVGSDYFLGTTAGTITTTAPSAAGNIVQRLGRASSTTSIPFENQFFFELS